MTRPPSRCLILACGNTLRGDDGVGLWLAEWAERRFADQPGVRVLASFQWTPDIAEDVARAASVLFVDCSVDSAPGSVKLTPVDPAPPGHAHSTHHLDAAQLLALARDLYNSLPRNADLLTIGAGSTELGEGLSDTLAAALPEACRLIEEAVLRLIAN